jgi:hypothetical protein
LLQRVAAKTSGLSERRVRFDDEARRIEEATTTALYQGAAAPM